MENNNPGNNNPGNNNINNSTGSVGIGFILALFLGPIAFFFARDSKTMLGVAIGSIVNLLVIIITTLIYVGVYLKYT